MSKTTLPLELIVEGVVYKLEVNDITEGTFAGWTSIVYTNDDIEFIYPSVAIEGYIEYLVSMCPTKEEAVADMKRKVTYGDMTKNYSIKKRLI